MASELRISDHALQRMAQRNISNSDIDLILSIGSEVSDGFLVRRRDCENLEKSIKALLTRVRRLEGKRLVVSEGCVVTAYRAERSKEQKLLRRISAH